MDRLKRASPFDYRDNDDEGRPRGLRPIHVLVATLAALSVLLLGIVVLERGGSEGDSPASGVADLEEVELVADQAPECRARILSSSVTPTADLSAVIRDSRLQYSVISPAVPNGTAAALRVRTSYRVSCGLDRGIVGHRGGFRLTKGERSAEFRRLRINMERNLIRMFSTSTEQQGYQGLTCDLERAAVTALGDGRQAVDVPLLLTPEGVVAINVGLGIDGFRPGDTIANLRMIVQEI